MTDVYEDNVDSQEGEALRDVKMKRLRYYFQLNTLYMLSSAYQPICYALLLSSQPSVVILYSTYFLNIIYALKTCNLCLEKKLSILKEKSKYLLIK